MSDNANPPNVLREQEMYIVVVHPFEADTFNPLSTLDPYRESVDQLPESFHPEKGPFHPAQGPFLPPESFREPLPGEFDPRMTDEVVHPVDPRRGGLSEPHSYDPREQPLPKPIVLRGRGLPQPTSEGMYPPEGEDEYEHREDEIDPSPRRFRPTHDTIEEEGEEDEFEPTDNSEGRSHPPDLYDLAMPGEKPTIAQGIKLGMLVSR